MNSRNENRPQKCSNPIDVAVLGDYWLNALTSSDEAAIEEHLFECDYCGERLREVIALAEGIRELAREGSLRMVVSDAFLKRASAEGLRAPILRASWSQCRMHRDCRRRPSDRTSGGELEWRQTR